MSVNSVSFQKEVQFLSQRKDFTKADQFRLAKVVTDITDQIKLQQATGCVDLALAETVIKAEEVANKNWKSLSQAEQERLTPLYQNCLNPMFARAHAIMGSYFPQPCNFKKYEEQLNRLSVQANLTTEDKAALVKMVPDLLNQVKLQPDPSSIIKIIAKAKEVVEKHHGQFNESEKEVFKPLFAQTDVIVNEEHWDVDSYTWANSLKGLSPLLAGDSIAEGNVVKDVKIPSFNQHFNDFKAYIKDKALPESMDDLFSLFKAADEADFEELKNACLDKISSGNNQSVKGALLLYAVDAGQYELAVKCLPLKTKEMVEAVGKLNKCLPEGWVFNMLPSVQGMILNAQYEEGLLTLHQLQDILTEMRPPEVGILLKVQENALKLKIAGIGFEDSKFFDVISHIKVINKVKFPLTMDGKGMTSLSSRPFPHVKKIELGRFLNGPLPESVDFSKIFPNAMKYTFRAVGDEDAIRTVNQIPNNITRLKIKERTFSNFTERAPQAIIERFKELKQIKWKRSDGVVNPHSFPIIFKIFCRRISQLLHLN